MKVNGYRCRLADAGATCMDMPPPPLGLGCICGSSRSKVVDKRDRAGWIYRQRECLQCHRRFATKEERHIHIRKTRRLGECVA